MTSGSPSPSTTASSSCDFPSPYLNHFPTRLTVRRSDGRRLETREIRPDFGEAFVLELEAFWSAIVNATPVRNTVEQAGRDQRLLCDLARHVAGNAAPGEEIAAAGPGDDVLAGTEAAA